jgi:alkylation response protein AidB-like acyl-CoA dehydrogenase
MVWRDSVAFDLSEEENFACDTAKAFAEKEVAPLAAKIDREHYFPRELLPKMGYCAYRVRWGGTFDPGIRVDR